MKFNHILGNPPYERSLHLKILKETMEHVDFKKGGEIVWLHPAEWIFWHGNIKKDYSWLNSKYKCECFLNNEECWKVFNVTCQSGLVISHLFNNAGNPEISLKYRFPDSYVICESICHKCLDNMPTYVKPTDYDKTGYNVALAIIVGGSGGRSLKPQCYSIRKNVFTNDADDKVKIVIKFDDKTSAVNFNDSLKTKFIQFIDYMFRTNQHPNYKSCPFMQDYTKPWTDERFYEYFKLTPEEIKLIEDMIKD